ncbi:MAG: dihydroneopterin aldolase [Oscillospiraceae bacterium]|nr:dihydroneopterin aldolase [Oscillospiraceae bacterium]
MQHIAIKGLDLYAYHGVHAHEREQGQPFVLDITLWANMSAACTSDDLADTVNYSRVIDCAAAAFCAEKHQLIERAASVTGDAILAEFAPIQRLEITVHKPQAPVRQSVKDIAFTLKLAR